MKYPLILAALAGAALAGPPMTDRITPEEIAARRKSSPLAAIPQPAPGQEHRVLRPGGMSLIKQSDILNDGIHWTIVPKGAVLHTPATFAERVGAKPLGRLLTWDDFLRANRSWLFTEEVSLDQASGKTPFLPSRHEAWNTVGKVIVAVHFGGPISVRQEAATPVAAAR